jgi:EAL domain-containing protein (putative c-di-GMP-specific phosphodiesterase class I)/CheY-like chemotaxis protein
MDLNSSIAPQNEKPIILCVDDEDIILISLKNHLKKNFKDLYQVEIAQSGEIALDIIRECIEDNVPIPVIISDQIMPGMKGDEFLTQAHKLIPNTKKIMLTGQANAEAVGNALNNASLYRFLTKPWHPEDLNLTVQEAIRSYFVDRDLEIKNQVLEKALYFHPISNFPNYSKLEKDLEKWSQDLFIILIKIENYPDTVKTFGMQLYNKLVKQYLESISIMTSDQIYHLYEDELAILTSKSNNDINKFAFEINQIFSQNPLKVEETLFQITTTISAANGSPHEDLYSKAKIALLVASNNHKEEVIFYNPDMNASDKFSFNLVWGKKLKDAISNKTVTPYFQGIQDNRTGIIKKYECLARIEDNGQIYSPYQFIDLAKTTGTISIITNIMLERSMETFQYNTHSFSINLTEYELEDKAFPLHLEHLFTRYKIDPNRVIFEILEQVNLTTGSQSMKTIQILKNMNCKISLDDFGVLNSNLSRILEIDPDYIKIDGKFIRNIVENPTAFLLTKSIKDLSKSIGAETIAEFVSSKPIQDKVLELEIEYSQGYYIMEPERKI